MQFFFVELPLYSAASAGVDGECPERKRRRRKPVPAPSSASASLSDAIVGFVQEKVYASMTDLEANMLDTTQANPTMGSSGHSEGLVVAAATHGSESGNGSRRERAPRVATREVPIITAIMDLEAKESEQQGSPTPPRSRPLSIFLMKAAEQ